MGWLARRRARDLPPPLEVAMGEAGGHLAYIDQRMVAADTWGSRVVCTCTYATALLPDDEGAAIAQALLRGHLAAHS